MIVKVIINYNKGFKQSKRQLKTSGGLQLESFEQKVEWYRYIAQRIYEVSQILVPVKNGRLRDTGKIVQNTDGTFKVEYNTDYAVFVHEVIGNTHLKPTQSKFLEDAAFLVLYEMRTSDEFVVPMFTFHLEMSVESGVNLYIDSITDEEFLGWMKEAKFVNNMETID